MTADPMFSHADVCARVLQKQGDYILYAKKNQAELRDDLEATFAAAEGGEFPPWLRARWDDEVRVATTSGKGHGRLERRTITTTTWLNEYLGDWPGVAQVFRLERRKAKGREDVEVVYGITSLSESAADAWALLGYTASL